MQLGASYGIHHLIVLELCPFREATDTLAMDLAADMHLYYGNLYSAAVHELFCLILNRRSCEQPLRLDAITLERALALA